MRARKRDKRNLIRVGAFISGLTLVLMIMIVSIGKENSIFDDKIDIKARVENVSNLKTGSYVELKGIRVGTVKNITIISDEEVEITISVLEEQLKWIKQDSLVAISTAGLVGDKFLEIYSGSKDAPPIDPKSDILRSGTTADMKKILSKGDSIASTTDRILTKLDNILTHLEDGRKIVDTLNSLNRTSNNLEKLSSDLSKAQVGETFSKLNRASTSMEKIMSRIESGPGTAHSFIYDDSIHDDLRALLGGAQRNKVIKYFIRQSIKNSEKKNTEED